MDVKMVNMPDLGAHQYGSDQYIYAGYLKPGYHQLLIYDPALERAFCQDFIVNLNMREDMFPEYPTLEVPKEIEKIEWVWRNWLPDHQNDIVDSFKLDC